MLGFHKNLQTIRIGFVKTVSFENQSLLLILVQNCQQNRVDVQKGVKLMFLSLIYDAIVLSTCKNTLFYNSKTTGNNVKISPFCQSQIVLASLPKIHIPRTLNTGLIFSGSHNPFEFFWGGNIYIVYWIEKQDYHIVLRFQVFTWGTC